MTKLTLALLLFASCGDTLESTTCSRPPQSKAPNCDVIPQLILDNGDGTSTCVGYTPPPSGCKVWNGVAYEGFCVPQCP